MIVTYLTISGANPSPTKKLAVQFVTTAIEVAIPRADWVKSSVTKNHGIDPGPVANPTTKVMTMTIEMYFNAGTASCKENSNYFWINQALRLMAKGIIVNFFLDKCKIR